MPAHRGVNKNNAAAIHRSKGKANAIRCQNIGVQETQVTGGNGEEKIITHNG